MALLSWMLFWLNVRKRIWTGLWAINGGLVGIHDVPVHQRRAGPGKERFVGDVPVLGSNAAAYSATLIALMGGAAKLLMRKFPKTPASGSGADLAVVSR